MILKYFLDNACFKGNNDENLSVNEEIASPKSNKDLNGKKI